jgi:hypothetical protein
MLIGTLMGVFSLDFVAGIYDVCRSAWKDDIVQSAR